MSSAHFKNPVQFDSLSLSGPKFTDIESKNTQVLNSLNEHKTLYASQSATLNTTLTDLSTQLSAEVANRTSADASLATSLSDMKVLIDADIAAEVSARQADTLAAQNARAILDAKIQANTDAHALDSDRLTSVETSLQNVDTNLQEQITSAVNALNINHQNVEPRTAKLEEYFVIDETDPENPVVRIKTGVQFEVSGSFVQG